jgi:hypothetical protein
MRFVEKNAGADLQNKHGMRMGLQLAVKLLGLNEKILWNGCSADVVQLLRVQTVCHKQRGDGSGKKQAV